MRHGQQSALLWELWQQEGGVADNALHMQRSARQHHIITNTASELMRVGMPAEQTLLLPCPQLLPRQPLSQLEPSEQLLCQLQLCPQLPYQQLLCLPLLGLRLPSFVQRQLPAWRSSPRQPAQD